MTTLLAIETSSIACSVALLRGGEVFEDHRLVPRQHNALVLRMIDDLFGAAGVRPAQLDGVGFGRGPGSFTGVRIAAAIAQGLSLATNARVLGLSSLETMARAVLEDQPASGVLATLPSRTGELYLGAFRNTGSDVVLMGDEQVGPPAELVIPEGDLHDWLIVGEPARTLVGRWHTGSPRVVDHVYPRAAAMLTAAARILDEGRPVSDEVAVPVYLQAGEPWRKSTL